MTHLNTVNLKNDTKDLLYRVQGLIQTQSDGKITQDDTINQVLNYYLEQTGPDQ